MKPGVSPGVASKASSSMTANVVVAGTLSPSSTPSYILDAKPMSPAESLRLGMTGTVDHKKQQQSLVGANSKKASVNTSSGANSCKAPWTPEVSERHCFCSTVRAYWQLSSARGPTRGMERRPTSELPTLRTALTPRSNKCRNPVCSPSSAAANARALRFLSSPPAGGRGSPQAGG